MQINDVRTALKRQIGPKMSIAGLATVIQVPHMTLRRFVQEETNAVNPEAWTRMVTYVASLREPTVDQALGILRAVDRVRHELELLERQAHAILGQDGVGAAVDETASASPAPHAATPVKHQRVAERFVDNFGNPGGTVTPPVSEPRPASARKRRPRGGG